MCARGGGGLLEERKALAAHLWEAGVKAELVHAAAPSQTFQYEWAAARGIRCLVTINAATFHTTDTVQVTHQPGIKWDANTCAAALACTAQVPGTARQTCCKTSWD